MSNAKLLHPKLSYEVTGICFKAHNEIGRYAKEKHYGNFIESQLQEKGLPFKREITIGTTGNILDFLIDDKIVLELKSKRIITKDDYYQVQRYLHATDKRLGLLVNFRAEYLTPKRIMRIDNFKFKEH